MKPALTKFALMLVRLLSHMPLAVHYFLSDWLLFPLSYYIIRYRRKLVVRQLTSSFPEKSPAEIKQIARRFYHFLCDYVVETIKLETMSNDEIRRRVQFDGIDEMHRQLDKDNLQFCFAYLGHYCNWEWMASFPLWLHSPWIGAQIYHPLHNKEADEHFLREREKFGGRCIPMKQTMRQIITAKRNGERLVIGFIADQEPKSQALHHWTQFLNRKTAFLVGSERIARQVGAAFYYIRVTRPRRGYYRAEVLPMNISFDEKDEFAVIDKYASMLEEQIRQQPELWLWTHNRWKHSFEEWVGKQS